MTKLLLSRKAKEILDRDELILDVAQKLLAEDGLKAMTMQAIANKVGCSKGTIYQHYRCKEEILASFVIRGGQRLAFILDEICKRDMSFRAKALLFSMVFLLNAKFQPEITSVVANVKSSSFQSGLTPEYQSRIIEVDENIMTRITFLLISEAGLTPEQAKLAAFGWWAMKWGVQDVLSNGWDMESIGFPDPQFAFFQSQHVFFNGFNIEDSSDSHDWDALQHSAKELLEESLVQITTRNIA